MTQHEYVKAFIDKHGPAGDWTVHTSPMRDDGSYVKTWRFADEAELVEVNRPIWRKAEADVELVPGVTARISQNVQLLESEMWNTDNAKSVKFYERW